MTLMNTEHDKHGIPNLLYDEIRHHLAQSQSSSASLDAIIIKLGPHHIAHFLVTTEDQQSAERLKIYLEQYWPAYSVLIERLIRAARRADNEELLSDFGQS